MKEVEKETVKCFNHSVNLGNWPKYLVSHKTSQRKQQENNFYLVMDTAVSTTGYILLEVMLMIQTSNIHIQNRKQNFAMEFGNTVESIILIVIETDLMEDTKLI